MTLVYNCPVHGLVVKSEGTAVALGQPLFDRKLTCALPDGDGTCAEIVTIQSCSSDLL